MFDSHAHVMFENFNTDRDQIFAHAQEAGVSGWIEVGTNLEQSKKAVTLAQQHENVWASVGVHPSDIESSIKNKESWTEIEKLLDQPRVVAVGEVGLDYYRGGTAEEQMPALQRFIDLALARNLPVIFHVRDGKDISAHADLITLLHSLPKVPRGVIHTYSGTLKQAKQYLKLGMYLSFSGVITFKNAGELLEVVKQTPLDKILIETDCPFLAPEPYRGKRNEPAYVKYVAQKIADLRGISFDEVQRVTMDNTQTLFRL